MIDVQHGALRPFKHHALSLADGVVQQLGRVCDKGPDALRSLGVFVIHLDRVQRVGAEQRVRHRVLLVAGVFDVRFEQTAIEQVDHPQSAAVHLVFVSGTDAAAGGADLLPSRSILRRQLNHAMVGQDHLGAIGDKKLLIDVDPQIAQLADLFKKRQWIQHHAVADDGTAVRTQNPARDQLQNEFLPSDDDGMPGVVTARIARHHRKPIGKNVDDLSLSLIAPLGAQYYRSLGSHVLQSISCDALFPCRFGLLIELL